MRCDCQPDGRTCPFEKAELEAIRVEQRLAWLWERACGARREARAQFVAHRDKRIDEGAKAA